MSFRTTILTSALASAVVLASCGGTNKKKTNYVGEAGAAGASEEAAGGAGDTGGSAGAAGAPEQPVPDGGAGGEPPMAPEGGSAGEAGAPPVVVVVPPSPPLPTVLFTVAPGATGLPGTAVAAQAYPASVIFGSTTANVDPISGTNKVMVTAAQLGIADGDVISAFALPQAVPAAPTYAFSIAGTDLAGQVPTRLSRSASDKEAPGDVYFSDTATSYHAIGGENGGTFGYNALVADEQTLGLSFTPHNASLDDLTGVQLLPAGVLSTAIYFAVSADSVGLPGTGVAAASAATRGCTVFKSNLDGTNSAFMACAALGLADDAQLKGLTLYPGVDSVEVLFTLDTGSTGLTGTAVSAAAATVGIDGPGPNNVQNNVYSSKGDGMNALKVAGSNLGLLHDDALDALAVYDRAAAYYGYATQCTLTPSPTTVEGANINSFESAHGLGDHLLLLHGQSSNADPAVDVIAAYDVKTCQLVAKVTLPFQTLETNGEAHWAPVPLAGWSAAEPLKNIEYWQMEQGDGQTGLRRFSASGAPLGSYLLDVDVSPNRLDYDPLHNRMFASVGRTTGDFTSDFDRLSFTLPVSDAPNNSAIPFLRSPMPHPCANQPRFSGTDAAGDSVYAQYDYSSGYRLCSLTPTGELADLPATWEESSGGTSFGLLVPGVAMYSLNTYPDYVVNSHPLGTKPVNNVSLPVTPVIPPISGGL